jgi:two-component system LytT family response regulator
VHRSAVVNVDCIRLALQTQSGVEVVAETGDGEAAVDAIHAERPDVVFLDVQMPELDGFGVVERLQLDEPPCIVFVTAYDEHAIRAFEVHALDYVLKPFDDARLMAALSRARQTVMERRQGELGRRLHELVQSWSHAAPRAHLGEAPVPQASSEGAGARANFDIVGRFAIRENGRVYFVPVASIDWIEADGNYLILHAAGRTHRMRATLGAVADKLDPKQFVRVHRSAVVNVDCIREVQPWFGGDYIAILRTGEKLRVSRLRAAQLLRPMT